MSDCKVRNKSYIECHLDKTIAYKPPLGVWSLQECLRTFVTNPGTLITLFILSQLVHSTRCTAVEHGIMIYVLFDIMPTYTNFVTRQYYNWTQCEWYKYYEPLYIYVPMYYTYMYSINKVIDKYIIIFFNILNRMTVWL